MWNDRMQFHLNSSNFPCNSIYSTKKFSWNELLFGWMETAPTGALPAEVSWMRRRL
jgi:hypothetical protein